MRRLPQSVYLPLLTSVVVVAGLTTYYLVSQSARAKYLDERAFRVLGALNRGVVETGERIWTVPDASGNAYQADRKTDTQRNEDRDRFIGNQLELFNPRQIARKGQVDRRTGVLELITADPSPPFTVKAVYSPAAAFGAPGRAQSQRVFVSTALDLRLPLDKELTRLGGDFFDSVLIADHAGAVWYQRTGDELAITDLVSLFEERPAEPEIRTSSMQERNSNSAEKKPGENFGRQLGHSRTLEREIGGVSYRLYSSPLSLTLVRDSKSVRLTIVGLLRPERDAERGMKVPHAFVIWGALAALTSFTLLWPVLKLFYMSPKERLRHSHVAYMLTAMIAGTALIVLMVLNASYVLRARRQTDDRLRSLAGAMQEHFETELRDAAQLLATTQPNTLSPYTGGDFQGVPNALRQFRDKLQGYPYFEHIFWTDKEGEQRLKYSAADSSPKTPVREAYFSDVKANRVASLELDDGSRLSLRLDLVLSPNTYEFYGVIGMREPGNSALPFKALVTRIHSLYEAVLPPGFGYAVVDPAGHVKMHSNASYNLQQNFLQETGRDQRLTRLLAEGGHGVMSLDYLGQSHRVYGMRLTDVATTPLTLLVFRDEVTPSTVNLVVVVVFAMLMFAYALPIILLVSGYLTRQAYPLDGLWPCPSRVSVYADLLPRHLVLLVAFVVSYCEASSLEAILLWPLLSIGAGLCYPWLLLRQPAPTRTLWITRVVLAAGITLVTGTRFGLILSVASLVVSLPWLQTRLTQVTGAVKLPQVFAVLTLLQAGVLVVAPAFCFFQFAANRVDRVALARSQLEMMRAVEARHQRLHDYYAPLQLPEIRERRTADPLDRYDVLGEPTIAANVKLVERWQRSWLEQSFVFAAAKMRLGAIAQDLLHVAAGSLSDVRRDWWIYEDNAKAAGATGLPALVLSSESSEAPLRVASSIPRWTGLESSAAASLIVALVLLYFWFRFLTETIFLVELENAPELEVWDAEQCPDDSNLLIIGPPRSSRQQRIRQLPNTDIVDFSRVARSRTWNKIAPARGRVALFYFDFDLEDPETNLRKLELIERLVYVQEKGVILLSSIDPMPYLSQHGAAVLCQNGDAARGSMLDRWAAIFSRLRKVRLPDIPSPAFKSKEFVENTTPGAKRALKLIEEECRHERVLEIAGCRLLRLVQNQNLSDDALIEQLIDAADPYYRLLWSTCTADERLVLFQLARDGWTNPKNAAAIQQLQRRRLVVRPRGLRVMNESFRRFVLRSQYPQEVRRWEQEERESLWRALRLSLAVASTLVAAWALYTHPSIASVLIASLTLLGTMVGGFTKVFGDLRSQIGLAAATRKATS